jgi:hypothetical protein
MLLENCMRLRFACMSLLLFCACAAMERPSHLLASRVGPKADLGERRR